jgi:hypothetical protein
MAEKSLRPPPKIIVLRPINKVNLFINVKAFSRSSTPQGIADLDSSGSGTNTVYRCKTVDIKRINSI